MLSLYIILLVLSLPILIPTTIVGLIIHFVNKNKRERQLAGMSQVYNVNNAECVISPVENNAVHEENAAYIIPQQPMVDAQPYYQAGSGIQSSPEKEKKYREPLSSSTVMLLIGTALVVLSGIAFGAANWLNTTPLGRVAIILTASVVSFLISFIFCKGVKLKGTSTAFYIVGSLMIPVAMVIAGFYDLMGKWFAVFGNGRFLLYAVGFAIIAAFCILGKKIYNAKHFVYTGLVMTSLAMFFTAIQAAYIDGKFESAIFGIVLILMQVAITAAIYVFRIHEKTSYAQPVKMIGNFSAAFYGFIAFSYAAATAGNADFATYFVIAAIIIQLVGYGIFKKQNWMLGAHSIFSIMLVTIIGYNTSNSLGTHKAILLTAYLLTVLYFINRFIPKLRNNFSCVLTLVGMFVAAVITLDDIVKISLFSALIIPVIFTVVIYAYVYDKRAAVQAAAGFCSPLMPCLIASAVDRYLKLTFVSSDVHEYAGFIAAAFLAAVTAVINYLPKFAFGFHANHPRKTDIVLYTGTAASLILLFTGLESKVFILIPLVIAAVDFFLANQQKNNIFSVGSVMVFLLYMFSGMDRIDASNDIMLFVGWVTFLTMMALSRIFYRKAIVTRSEGRTITDAPLMASWLLILYIVHCTVYENFFGCLAVAVYIACFIKKNTKEREASILLSVSAVFTSMALISRPFLVPDNLMVSNKITFAIIALTGLAFRVIWRKHEHGAKLSSNIIFVCTFAALMIDALYFENAGNTVFVLAVTTAILIVSFLFRSKTWFSVSSIAIVSIVVYSLKDFFGSLSGWVYLFAAGLILIGVAAVNEYCKQNGENVKTKLAHAFSDWKW